jgi:hypothetical protein
MALPASGQISMDDIRTELGVSTQSPFGLNQARLGTYANINQFSPSKPPSSGQVSLASWYNYCQNCGYNSGTFYYSGTSAALACAGTPDTTLYWSGTLELGTILYTDSTGNSEAAQGYWSNGTNAYFQNCPDGCYDGITSITACSVVIAYSIGYCSILDYTNYYDLCATTPVEIFSSTGVLEDSAVLYFNEYGTGGPLISYVNIVDNPSNCRIWEINPSTGIVSGATSQFCSSYGGCL